MTGMRVKALIAAIVALTSVCVTITSLRLGNTLEKHPGWVSAKVNMRARGLLGAEEFMVNRNTLAQDHLDLSQWFGYQEIEWHEPVKFGEADYRFQLHADSYLYFLFRQTVDGDAWAVRVSRNSRFPSALLQISGEGEFLKKQPIEFPDPGEKWVDLIIRRNGSRITLIRDGREFATLDATLPDRVVIGLRGGRNPSLVDRIRVRDDRGLSVLNENFANTSRALWIFLACVLVLTLLNLDVFIVKPLRPSALPLSVALLSASLLSMVASGTATVASIHLGNYWPTHEFVERIVKWGDDQARLELASYLVHPAKTRIMFFGTSQIWGAGARGDSERSSRRLEAKIASDTGVSKSIFNSAVRAATLRNIFDEYQKYWISWKPQIVVANLGGGSDRGNKDFKKDVEALLQFNEKHHISTVITLEATTPEGTPEQLIDGRDPLFDRHEDLRRAVANHAITLIDMQKFYSSPEVMDSGFIWWDFGHMTSYGQKLYADEIFKVLKPRLPKI